MGCGIGRDWYDGQHDDPPAPPNVPGASAMTIVVATLIPIKGLNRVLVARRLDKRNPELHGRWEFPGGKVELGEHPRDAVTREIREELGIDVEPAGLPFYVGIHTVERHPRPYLVLGYRTRPIEPDVETNLDTTAISGIRFLHPGDARREVELVPSAAAMLKEIDG